MQFEKLNAAVAALRCGEVCIATGQDAMDVIASARYETGCGGLIVPKAALHEDFFRLPTGLAGEVLQKFVNYGMKIAVVGDFSQYTSKNLQDFLWESNKGKAVFFVSTEAEALERLSNAK